MGNVVFLPVVQNKEWGSNHPWSRYVDDWYSTEGYHKLWLQHRGYKQYDTGVPKIFWREMRRWMENDLEGEVLIHIEDRSSSGWVTQYAYFELESDLIAFKLAWGDHLTDE